VSVTFDLLPKFSPSLLGESFASAPLHTTQADISFLGLFWKCARIGERLSPYVSLACVIMAVMVMLGK
jgi:hypothetical protein